ncbi:MAG: TonB-dependent receptor [Bacteroidota bacterium]
MTRFFLPILLILPFSLFAQKKFTVSGYITDYKSGEALIGATLYDSGTKKGTITNTYGFYSMTINTGEYCLKAKYVGYNDSTICFTLKNDTVLNIRLNTNLVLKDIVVKARKKNDATSSLSGLSQQKLNIPMLNRMPVIAGEKDLLKSLQYMPGVKAGREGSASFNVRGGSNDQNLILLDGVPVYNVSHLMGFFSVFNNDAIKNADLYKGGIPARYGGRLSSVLDVNMKEGNLFDEGGVFSISPISARISFESPIKVEKGAYIVSYRRSFIDLPMRLIQKLADDNGEGAYFFHDFNGKANWKFNDRNRIYLSTYFGKDKLVYTYKDDDHKSRGEYNWGNLTSVIRWNKIFSNQLFANFSAYYSRFQHFQSSGNKEDSISSLFSVTSKLKDLSLKADFDYYPGSNYLIKFGFKYSSLEFAPNIQYIRHENVDETPEQPSPNKSDQAALYFENAFNTGKFDLNLGARLSAYNANKKNYFYLQPRASVKYNHNNFFNVSITYTKMVQFLHLLTSSSMGMPTDLWAASTDKTGPQKAQQFSLGFSSGNFKKYQFGIETYYKWMDDVIRFDEGTAFLNTDSYNWEENIITGKGKAYGIELMAEKKTGKVTGLASYTLAWSERKFDEINTGEWFPFKYDRRHDLSLLAEYHFPEKYLRQKSISIGFTLQSGNNISIPDTEIKGVVPIGLETENSYWHTRETFDNPNNFKMPAFHHLDIGYNIKQKKTSTSSISWNFSIYNVYNRLNPWYYYKDEGKVKQVALFPIIPSVSFTYRW